MTSPDPGHPTPVNRISTPLSETSLVATRCTPPAENSLSDMTALKILVTILLGIGGAAQAQIGPDYERPASALPERFKTVAWRSAAPAAHLPKGEWWKVFRDPVLNRLQEDSTAGNQELKGAMARFEQARLAAR